MNLITNAAEAISNVGQIVVSTRNQYIENPIVSNQYLERGEYVVVSCRDTGSGIPDEDIRKISNHFIPKKQWAAVVSTFIDLVHWRPISGSTASRTVFASR
ncbi:MAG: hypothetical protein GY702_17200 [Desulfobulbaceae bacterium]|nr:hypothetical protein [Desulfobulbaceae bacterium]